jgi:hypothetical protein
VASPYFMCLEDRALSVSEIVPSTESFCRTIPLKSRFPLIHAALASNLRLPCSLIPSGAQETM